MEEGEWGVKKMRYSILKGVILNIIILFAFVGCSNQSGFEEKIAEFEVKNQELTKQIESLERQKNEEIHKKNKEIESLKDQINECINNNIDFDSDDIKLKDFFDNNNICTHPTDFQKFLGLVNIKSQEPLRILPSYSSPTLGGAILPINEEVDIPSSRIAEALVTVMGHDENGKPVEWTLVNSGGYIHGIGYIQSSKLSEYHPQTITSYQPKEQFKDIKVGTNIDKIYDMYSDKIELILPRYGWFKMLAVYDTNEPDRERMHDSIIDFFYNPNVRKIDFIRTTNPGYELESGFKVGDSTQEVFAYYDELYPQKDIGIDIGPTYRIYDIGDGFTLEIKGGVNEGGVVTMIIINLGYNMYV